MAMKTYEINGAVSFACGPANYGEWYSEAELGEFQAECDEDAIRYAEKLQEKADEDMKAALMAEYELEESDLDGSDIVSRSLDYAPCYVNHLFRLNAETDEWEEVEF